MTSLVVAEVLLTLSVNKAAIDVHSEKLGLERQREQLEKLSCESTYGCDRFYAVI